MSNVMIKMNKKQRGEGGGECSASLLLGLSNAFDMEEHVDCVYKFHQHLQMAAFPHKMATLPTKLKISKRNKQEVTRGMSVTLNFALFHLNPSTTVAFTALRLRGGRHLRDS